MSVATLVQTAPNASVTAGTSVSTSFADPTTADNLIVIGVFNFNSNSDAAAPSSVDLGSQAATSVVHGGPADAGVVAIYGVYCTTPATTVTANYATQTAGKFSFSICAMEWNGPTGLNADKTVSGGDEENAWVVGTTAETTSQNELVFAVFGGWNNAAFTPIPATEWVSLPKQALTGVAGSMHVEFFGAWLLLETEQTVEFNGTDGSTNYWNTGAVATFVLPAPVTSFSGAPVASFAVTFSCTGSKSVTDENALVAGTSWVLSSAGAKAETESVSSSFHLALSALAKSTRKASITTSVAYALSGTSPSGSAVTAHIAFALTATGKSTRKASATRTIALELSTPGGKRITKSITSSIAWEFTAVGDQEFTGNGDLAVDWSLTGVGSSTRTASASAAVVFALTSVAPGRGSPVLALAFTASNSAGNKEVTEPVTLGVNLAATATATSTRTADITALIRFEIKPLRVPLVLGGTDILIDPYDGTITETNLFGGTVVSNADTDLGGAVTDDNLFGGMAVGWTMQMVDITIGEFNDDVLDFTITNFSQPFNLSYYNVQVLFKATSDTPDADAAIFLSTQTSGVTITDAAAGEITVKIPHIDIETTNISFYRIDVVDSRGNENTAIYGDVTVLAL